MTNQKFDHVILRRLELIASILYVNIRLRVIMRFYAAVRKYKDQGAAIVLILRAKH